MGDQSSNEVATLQEQLVKEIRVKRDGYTNGSGQERKFIVHCRQLLKYQQ